jgi:fructosamine-3-kinase
MGALPQSNCRHDDWISFFIEERLEKQVRLAQNSGLLERKDINRFERLYTLFDTLIPKEQPSLIHGDLWGGNYLCSTAAEPYLIDPAAHYGHRESDLAMTTLFGGFSTEFYTAYHEAYPIEKGWEGRLDLYNLYPLLIHLNLFGPSYHGSIRIILQRFS